MRTEISYLQTLLMLRLSRFSKPVFSETNRNTQKTPGTLHGYFTFLRAAGGSVLRVVDGTLAAKAQNFALTSLLRLVDPIHRPCLDNADGIAYIGLVQSE